MVEVRNADRPTSLEDRRMWRLLLARLHPDAGGSLELFLFASAVRDEARFGARSGVQLFHDDSKRRTKGSAEHFLRAWQEAMGCWALRNREALKNLRG